jgi:hypothetical protein
VAVEVTSTEGATMWDGGLFCLNKRHKMEYEQTESIEYNGEYWSIIKDEYGISLICQEEGDEDHFWHVAGIRGRTIRVQNESARPAKGPFGLVINE